MDKLGFIGLGVMGEPMCRNLARRQRGKVLAYDLRPEPLKRLGLDGVAAASSVAELASQADVIFLCFGMGESFISRTCEPDAKRCNWQESTATRRDRRRTRL